MNSGEIFHELISARRMRNNPHGNCMRTESFAFWFIQTSEQYINWINFAYRVPVCRAVYIRKDNKVSFHVLPERRRQPVKTSFSWVIRSPTWRITSGKDAVTVFTLSIRATHSEIWYEATPKLFIFYILILILNF